MYDMVILLLVSIIIQLSVKGVEEEEKGEEDAVSVPGSDDTSRKVTTPPRCDVVYVITL